MTETQSNVVPLHSGHEALTFVEGLGPAQECAAVKEHRPRPLRHIWHHILPQACGGKTVVTNLVSLCDNCHYAIHVLLWQLGQGESIDGHINHFQRKIAQQGYEAAVVAGTVSLIPKEAAAA